MIHKCSYSKVLEIFFIEPTTIHFIREIGKRIKLAPTSVRQHIKELLKEDLIKVKEAKPFNALIANRDNENFIFYKKIYNLYSLKDLTNFIIKLIFPKAIILYGSYSYGTDVETSDIDIFILSKTKKEIDFKKFEIALKRNIHIYQIDNLNHIDSKIRINIQNGIILNGAINWDEP